MTCHRTISLLYNSASQRATPKFDREPTSALGNGRYRPNMTLRHKVLYCTTVLPHVQNLSLTQNQRPHLASEGTDQTCFLGIADSPIYPQEVDAEAAPLNGVRVLGSATSESATVFADEWQPSSSATTIRASPRLKTPWTLGGRLW